jgi:hypothetical protein
MTSSIRSDLDKRSVTSGKAISATDGDFATSGGLAK